MTNPSIKIEVLTSMNERIKKEAKDGSAYIKKKVLTL